MADIVIAHGGTINEFIGDAIFAVFGAPVEHADHAERAAATALAMQRAMDALNRANAARGRPRFEMGIGLHTGEAVVGNIGSEQRTKYAVVGAAVNLAARVEGCTVGGQILMTAATAERLSAIWPRSAPPDLRRAQGPDGAHRALRAAGHRRPLRSAPGRRGRRRHRDRRPAAGRCRHPGQAGGRGRLHGRGSPAGPALTRGRAERRAGRTDQRAPARDIHRSRA